MRVALWSEFARTMCGVIVGVGAAFAVAGCSSDVSRFDFPSFNLADGSSGEGDLATTASLPPSQPGYSAGRYAATGSRSTPPRVQTAAYSTSKPRYYGAPSAAKPPTPPQTNMAQVAGPRVKVGPGDTLSSLSQRYGVSVNAIQTANNLPDGRLREGQVLVIPGAKAAATPKPASRVAATTPKVKPGEKTYVVQAGDTPGSVAQKFGTSQKDIMVRNDIRADALQIGQTLVIPMGGAPTVAQAPAAKSGVRTVKTTTIRAPGAGPNTAEGNKQPAAKPQGNASNVASSAQLPNPDPLSGNSFRWPVKGRVISEFGTKSDGSHNDGINISVPQGTPVKAAENGVVAYAGSELKGYGNLVLVRHANNWVSAYANNEQLLVNRGEKVNRGQVIAKAGASGTVSQPQVHFELRKGSRPVDPTKYMSSMAAQAN